MKTCHSEGFLKEAHCDLTNVDLFDATDQTFALETDILERTIQLYNRKKNVKEYTCRFLSWSIDKSNSPSARAGGADPIY